MASRSIPATHKMREPHERAYQILAFGNVLAIHKPKNVQEVLTNHGFQENTYHMRITELHERC